MKFASHAEGYIEPDGGGGYGYVYQYKDHLGNVRLSYSDANNDGTVDNTEIVEESNYYPFGLKHKGYNDVVNGIHYPYGFGGKEDQKELDLNWLNFGARNYDAALGRWMNIDPLAKNYMTYSPYGYAINNPVINVDEAGKFVLPAHILNNPKYKRLVRYVKNGIQNVLYNKKVVNALKKYGGFTDAQLKEGLTYGSGPEINVKQLGKKWGEPINGLFDSQEPSVLNIDVDIVEALEKAEGLDRDTWLFILASTILHEYVHYGDEQDGEETPGEEGIAFELEAYGINVGQNEFDKAKEFIKKWLEEWRQKREDDSKKTVGFNNLINNFDSLQSGTYKWDGESWQKTE